MNDRVESFRKVLLSSVWYRGCHCGILYHSRQWHTKQARLIQSRHDLLSSCLLLLSSCSLLFFFCLILASASSDPFRSCWCSCVCDDNSLWRRIQIESVKWRPITGSVTFRPFRKHATKLRDFHLSQWLHGSSLVETVCFSISFLSIIRQYDAFLV